MLAREDLLEAYGVADRERPLLRMNFVSSLDGAATVAGRSAALGGDTDRAIMQVLRAMSDVIMVGAGTVRAEGYGGTQVEGADAAWRRAHGLADQPRLAVVSRALDIGAEHPFFAEAVRRPFVITCDAAPEAVRGELSDVADVLVCGEGDVELGAAVRELAAAGLGQVLCEGGPHLFGALHASGQVDEVCLTLSPQLVGGESGRIMRGASEAVVGMHLESVLRDEDWLFLRYSRGGRRGA